jgi:hypothetical protein
VVVFVRVVPERSAPRAGGEVPATTAVKVSNSSTTFLQFRGRNFGKGDTIKLTPPIPKPRHRLNGVSKRPRR